MQRAQINVQSAQFHAPASAGYAGASRMSLASGAISADDWICPPADTDVERAESPAALVRQSAQVDLLKVFVERTAGTAIERFHVAMYFVAFFAVLAATLMYQGAASASSFNLLFSAGIGSIGVAAVTFIGVRAWLVGQLREVAVELGMSDEQALLESREALRRIAAPFTRS